ncbi:MAG TPA: UrcA family protein [Caulobacteraceae bacterium]|jgi:UrcA family protein|nr:UrcA family protein [Caulobacteraceae bacterium]
MAAAFGLAAAAQDYNGGDYGKASYGGGMPASAGDYAYDTSATVGGVTVMAPRRVEHTATGAEVVITSASRVVDTSDLDLSTFAGMHELHSRVVAAAADACNDLDNQTTMGLYPLDGNDADCEHRAVDDAMAQVSAPY